MCPNTGSYHSGDKVMNSFEMHDKKRNLPVRLLDFIYTDKVGTHLYDIPKEWL